MSTIALFPTLIYKTVVGDYDQTAMIQRCQEYLSQYSEYKGGNLEGGAKGIHDDFGQLHKDPVFAPVVDAINMAVDNYWQTLNYSNEWHPGINQMWVNQYPKGGYATLHNHSPMWLTGVFYLVNEPGMGSIYFQDPNEALLGMQPLSDELRYENKYTTVDVNTGDLVIFPGWLNHGTHPNTTDRVRLAIPFEISFRGADLYQKFASGRK